MPPSSSGGITLAIILKQLQNYLFCDLIFYIISDKSNFITGQVINVDGGDWI